MQANAEGSLLGTPERTFERIKIIRELVGRKVPIAVIHGFSTSGAELAVLERYSTAVGLDAGGLDVLERDARRAMSLNHPNIAPARDVWREGAEVCVASEIVEGETLEELRRLALGGNDFSLEVGVRVLVDVLAALSALHTLSAGPMAHGEITASNVIVGYEGTTRIVRPFRGSNAGKAAEPEWYSYAAPELIRGAPADARSDLFSAGVLLWETLSKRKLFPKATREGRAARSLPIGKPAAPSDATWAAPLGAVAERALANDPAARYTSAAEMAAAVRLAVRSKLAMPPRVAASVDKLASEKILGRRTAFALPEEVNGVPSRVSKPPVPPEAMRVLSTIRPSSRPPPVMPKTAPPAPMPKPAGIPKIEPTLPSIASLPSIAKPPTGPRPFAPPLRLADPVKLTPDTPPAPVEDAAPISLDGELVMDGSESAPIAIAPVAIAAPPPPIELSAAGVPPRSRGLVIGIVLFAVVVAVAAIVGVVAFGGKAKDPSTVPSSPHATTTTTHPTTTGVTTSTTTANPTTTTSTAIANPTATETATPEGSTEPDPSASAAPTESAHRPHTRPRPTYDPMGI